MLLKEKKLEKEARQRKLEREKNLAKERKLQKKLKLLFVFLHFLFSSLILFSFYSLFYLPFFTRSYFIFPWFFFLFFSLPFFRPFFLFPRFLFPFLFFFMQILQFFDSHHVLLKAIIMNKLSMFLLVTIKLRFLSTARKQFRIIRIKHWKP